jgi:putative membrane protein
MRINAILILSFFTVIGLSSCDPSPNRKDTKETTEAQNDANIEATAPTDSAAHAQKEDAEDIAALASAGMMEVQLAKIALEKAVTPKVREFAQMMIDDHTKANKELEKIAMEKHIVLPVALMDKHQKVVNEVAEKTGKDFDKKYMNVMLDDHKEDVDKFQKIADKGNDSELKTFAAKTLPTLIHHREVAEQVEKITDKL